jgi:hypothetical protein
MAHKKGLEQRLLLRKKALEVFENWDIKDLFEVMRRQKDGKIGKVQ